MNYLDYRHLFEYNAETGELYKVNPSGRKRLIDTDGRKTIRVGSHDQQKYLSITKLCWVLHHGVETTKAIRTIDGSLKITSLSDKRDKLIADNVVFVHHDENKCVTILKWYDDGDNRKPRQKKFEDSEELSYFMQHLKINKNKTKIVYKK